MEGDIRVAPLPLLPLTLLVRSQLSVYFCLLLLSEIGSLSNDGNTESRQAELNGNEINSHNIRCHASQKR